MKRIPLFFVALSLCVVPVSRGQDAAVEERLNKLNGHVEDLLAAQAEQQKRIAALAKEIEAVREQQSQPNASYASQEDLKRLTDAVKELDQKRVTDNEKILKEIEKLGKTVSSTPASKRQTPKAASAPVDNPASNGTTSEKGYGYYTIRPNDTLSSIAKAYNDQGIKLTSDQILKANPGLDERKLIVGKKIWIPAPAQ